MSSSYWFSSSLISWKVYVWNLDIMSVPTLHVQEQDKGKENKKREAFLCFVGGYIIGIWLCNHLFFRYVSIGDIAHVGSHPPNAAAIYFNSNKLFAHPVGYDLVRMWDCIQHWLNSNTRRLYMITAINLIPNTCYFPCVESLKIAHFILMYKSQVANLFNHAHSTYNPIWSHVKLNVHLRTFNTMTIHQYL